MLQHVLTFCRTHYEATLSLEQSSFFLHTYTTNSLALRAYTTYSLEAEANCQFACYSCYSAVTTHTDTSSLGRAPPVTHPLVIRSAISCFPLVYRSYGTSALPLQRIRAHFISADQIDGLEAMIRSNGCDCFAEKHLRFLWERGDGDGGKNGGSVENGSVYC